MKRILSSLLFPWLCLAGIAAGQNSVLIASGPSPDGVHAFVIPSSDSFTAALFANSDRRPSAFIAPVDLPRMAPELALETYHRRSAEQAAALVEYSSMTLIRAELPETSQRGEYELRRHYTAPHTLVFKALRFTGDGFVKSNVITRLLQSEVNHVQNDDSSLTAITPANYKFSYKGMREVDGRLLHVYQLKPRQKRVGLFKGHIYLDAHTGSLVRAEGRVVKSPSFFIKKIEFAQDYADIGQFTLPVRIHSEARTRLIGRAVVDIEHRDYEPVSVSLQATASRPAL
jgi:hypothetical protein